MKKNVLSFEEAIELLRVGAYGFRFQSQRGDTFTAELDNTGRPTITPTEEEEDV